MKSVPPIHILRPVHTLDCARPTRRGGVTSIRSTTRNSSPGTHSTTVTQEQHQSNLAPQTSKRARSTRKVYTETRHKMRRLVALVSFTHAPITGNKVGTAQQQQSYTCHCNKKRLLSHAKQTQHRSNSGKRAARHFALGVSIESSVTRLTMSVYRSARFHWAPWKNTFISACVLALEPTNLRPI